MPLDVCERTPSPNSCIAFSLRWAKGGFLIEDAHDSRYETNVDYSFFTEPVSCEVYNKVGSTNVSTLVNVHCESLQVQGQGLRAGVGHGSRRAWGGVG